MRVLRWLFTDKASGRIVVGQWPNLTLGIFLASLIGDALMPSGSARTAVNIVGTVSLIVWAIDEILRGVNPWRRLLGVAVLLWLGIRGGVALAHHR